MIMIMKQRWLESAGQLYESNGDSEEGGTSGTSSSCDDVEEVSSASSTSKKVVKKKARKKEEDFMDAEEDEEDEDEEDEDEEEEDEHEGSDNDSADYVTNRAKEGLKKKNMERKKKTLKKGSNGRKVRTCRGCKGLGHDWRNCPSRSDNTVSEGKGTKRGRQSKGKKKNKVAAGRPSVLTENVMSSCLKLCTTVLKSKLAQNSGVEMIFAVRAIQIQDNGTTVNRFFTVSKNLGAEPEFVRDHIPGFVPWKPEQESCGVNNEDVQISVNEVDGGMSQDDIRKQAVYLFSKFSTILGKALHSTTGALFVSNSYAKNCFVNFTCAKEWILVMQHVAKRSVKKFLLKKDKTKDGVGAGNSDEDSSDGGQGDSGVSRTNRAHASMFRVN
jgi:hypothetical protein